KMGLCCLIEMLKDYFRILSVMMSYVVPVCVLFIPVPVIIYFLLKYWLRKRNKSKLLHLTEGERQKVVTVGLFHPYCNAGGGGERVLWCAIRALQNRYPFVRCIVYTGDANTTGSEILLKAQQRFNIKVPKDVEFVFLKKRHLVEADMYPYFTLLGQSVGSVILAWEAMLNYIPDVYIDTMGYAFTIPLFKFMGGCKVGAYVHYPTISTDMLTRVQERTATYNNAGFISRSPVLSYGKLLYYKLFAYLYGMAGKRCDVIMVNSTWTFGHIVDLWTSCETTHVVYPPCDTKAFLELPLERNTKGPLSIVSIAQFRPEKDHPLQVKAFAKFLDSVDGNDTEKEKYQLILVGSCRNAEDAQRVDNLKDLCNVLKVQNNVQFKLNVAFSDLKQHMAEATAGLHTMWNEHFGIGVVELMAAGTVILAHNSGGPKLDIVIEYNEKPTGFLADSEETYAEKMAAIFKLTEQERLEYSINARESVTRFSEEEFEVGFLNSTEVLFRG
ncbi:unnamed protein product, partial [Owenia fusiformis]